MKRIIWFAAVVMLIASCNDHPVALADVKNADKPGVTTGGPEPSNQVQFKVNGEQVKTTAWCISRFRWDGSSAGVSLNITTNMHEDKRTINVNLNGSVAGRYLLGSRTGNQQSYGSYYPDYMDDLTNSFSFADGEFNITSIDTTKNLLNAAFYGTVKNLREEKFTITDGKIINGLLVPGIMDYQ